VTQYSKPDAVVHWTPAGPRGLDSRAVLQAVSRLTLSLRAEGLERGARVAILSENRPEWLLVDYALLAAGAVPVPIYTSLAPAQIEYILSNSGAWGVVVSTPDLLRKVASVRSRLPALKAVIVMDPPAAPDPSLLPFKEVVRRGADLVLRDPDAFRRISAAANPEDLASIIYTSGTTGPPKGVMLTHGNFLSNVEATGRLFDFTPADRALSFLPLSHVFERTADYLYMYYGVTIVHVLLDHVPEAFRAVRPTVIASVPRLFEKMRDRIEAKVAGSSEKRRRLFAWAREAGRAARLAPLNGGPSPGALARLRYAVADRLVLRKVREGLGGRLRFAISGGAPLPREVFDYFTSLGVTIVEGYGLTETSPVIAINDPKGIRPGTVGRPLAGTEVRIASDGEILSRGPGTMQGYFTDPGGTATALEGGWFHTGDIGALDADGFLRITDRKKDLLITSGGKNVAPQPLESALRATGLVAQAVVVGNARRFVSALIVPEKEALSRLCASVGVPAEPIEDAVRRAEVLSVFENTVRESMRDFATFEQVKRFTILPRELSIEEGELTPTLKVRRKIVEERYRREIDAMYLDPPGAPRSVEPHPEP